MYYAVYDHGEMFCCDYASLDLAMKEARHLGQGFTVAELNDDDHIIRLWDHEGKELRPDNCHS
jgi:hypothetical protein